jgi:hypothetical protein
MQKKTSHDLYHFAGLNKMGWQIRLEVTGILALLLRLTSAGGADEDHATE